MANIFSGLENLGFKNLSDADIFRKKEVEKQPTTAATPKVVDPLSQLYDKECTCPVCEHKFKAKTVKVNAPRIKGKDSDFMIIYSDINPYFYDVILCPICGYAAMRSDFEKIKSYQKDLIRVGISSKWTGKNYPELFDANIAIERYKLALINAMVIEAKSSTKAMICLKLAWMYRILKDNENETIFIEKAIEGFNDAFENEVLPVYGLQSFAVMYLLGELSRRINKQDDALRWFGKVITSPQTPQKIKDLARDMRDLMKNK